MTEEERQPITKTRSDWHELDRPDVIEALEAGGSAAIAIFLRRVHDGNLRAIRSIDKGRWHLSISWGPQSEKQARKGNVRYPTWDEIADARDKLLPADVEFAMYLPRAGEYVAFHDTTFHLHEHGANEAQRGAALRLQRLIDVGALDAVQATDLRLVIAATLSD